MARAQPKHLALLSGDLLTCEDFYHVCLINDHGDHGGFSRFTNAVGSSSWGMCRSAAAIFSQR
jgi:hypothetical protein